MTVHLLAPAAVAALESATLTYDEVGATRGALPTAGYRTLRQVRVLSDGTEWASVRDALLRWQVPDRAGLRVRASSARIGEGSVGVLSFGWGRVSVRAPVRVVYLEDQPEHCAFAYGTLPRHPEAGEERFALDRAPDGRITFTITAFSRPATMMTRVAGPVGRLVQSGMTSRYLRSL